MAFHTQLPGILFSYLNLANAGAGSNQIGILGRQVNETKVLDAAVVIRGASFWGRFQQHIVWSHPGLILISDSLFRQWNKTSTAIEIQQDRAMISNNYLNNKWKTDFDKVHSVMNNAAKIYIHRQSPFSTEIFLLTNIVYR
jgi:hypothetical protein